VTRIRVLRIIDRLNVGGPALQAAVLSRGLDPSRFDQRLLAGSIAPGEGDYRSLRAPDLRVERVPGLGRAPNAWDDARAFRRIVAVMREFDPHIVHTHKAKAGVLGRLAAWSTCVPSIVHSFHGHLLTGYFSPGKIRVIIAVERAFARGTTTLVAVGAQVRDDLLAAGVGRPEQYRIVAPGVVLRSPPSREEARRSLGLSGDGPVVAFIGRLTQVKRPDRFIDAAIEVSRAFPAAVFAVVGEGDLLASMQARARPLGARAAFLGWRADVETVYAASDLLVSTSDNEGMPVSLIEAATMGTPAVTTRVGSAPEVVLDGLTGLAVGPTVGELAAATKRLLGDESLRYAMGAAAREQAQRRFRADRLISEMADIYERVAVTHRW
jgi:glycosyltransferase involved in cell wall biosynthesis